MDVGTFVTQAFQVFQSFHELTPKIVMIGVLTLIISAWKVSVFKPYWEKLGSFKTLCAPASMFFLAVINSVNGPLNFHIIFNALMIGFTSVGFHELLDSIKLMPHIGPRWVVMVNVISDLTHLISKQPLKLVKKK